MASSITTLELICLEDEIDGKNEGVTFNAENLAPGHAVALSNVYDKAYNMKHLHRGHCVIFNQKKFHKSTNLKERNGTDRDRDIMTVLFRQLGFQVDEKDDLTVNKIKRVLDSYSRLDHSAFDCFVIVFMTHGEDGKLYGSDNLFKTEELFQKFTGDKCPTLAGKPKMFFIQACRDGLPDPGTELYKTETDGGDMSMYKIPNQADFLMCWATVPGHLSWRDPNKGSWFMQSLNKVFTECASSDDVLSMMTNVNCHMIQHFESNGSGMHGMKQCTSINSTLMKKVYLSQKTPVTSLSEPVNTPENVSEIPETLEIGEETSRPNSSSLRVGVRTPKLPKFWNRGK